MREHHALDHAFEGVRQDRWLLGFIREGRLRVLRDSGRAAGRSRRLSALARRALFERQPVAVCSLLEDAPRDPIDDGDWELCWPALIYAPIARPRARPHGLLIVGSRRPHWYSDREVQQVAAVAACLSGCLAGTPW